MAVAVSARTQRSPDREDFIFCYRLRRISSVEFLCSKSLAGHAPISGLGDVVHGIRLLAKPDQPSLFPGLEPHRSRLAIQIILMRIAMIGIKAIPARFGGFETAV